MQVHVKAQTHIYAISKIKFTEFHLQSENITVNLEKMKTPSVFNQVRLGENVFWQSHKQKQTL